MHSVWSALVLSSWKSTPEVCCRSYGTWAKLKSVGFSMLLGWWGFPWGLIMTRVQAGRNLVGLVSNPDPARPSAQLEKRVRAHLASRRAPAGRQPQVGT